MRASRIILILGALGAIVLLTAIACRRIPMYEPTGGVFLELFVDEEHNIDPLCENNLDAVFQFKAKGLLPEIAHVLFYDISTHEQVYETFLPPTGGFIEVNPGVYDVIVYGMGADHIRLNETRNRGLFKAYTDHKGSLSYAGNTRPLIAEPDQFYAGRAAAMEIPVRDENSDITRLHIDLLPMVQTYTFIAYNISGLENVTSVTCYITGQAPDRFLWDEHFTVDPCAIDFTGVVNQEEGTIKNVYNTFGKIPGFSAKAILHVGVQTKSGDMYQWMYDITDQCDNPDNTCHIIVVDDPIVIPAEKTDISTGVGVQPWNPEIINIVL